MNSNAYRAYRRWATEPLAGPPMISVVIPAYNEEWRILPTIGAIASHVSSMGVPWELIVADDGSTDGTVGLVEALRFPNLQLLVPTHNGGKGSAVRRGVQAARGDYILFADADQSTPIEQLDLLLDRLQHHGYAIAVGSRAAHGAEEASKSLLRKVLSGGLRTLVRVGFGIAVRDTQCGFKLFRADAARRIFARQRIDGFSFDLEVLYLAHKMGLRVAEVPVQWIDAPGSKVRPLKVASRFLADLVRIRINDLTHRYEAPAPPARVAVDVTK